MVNVTRSGEYYECVGCGNIIEVKRMGGGELICCGQPMKSIHPEGSNVMPPRAVVVQH